MDCKTYFSEEFREEMLELSDNHIWWDINRLWTREIDTSELELMFYTEKLGKVFEEHYHTPVYLCGRSGRHVCVENTPVNRRNYKYMARTIDIMQQLIVKAMTAENDYWQTHLIGQPKWLWYATRNIFKLT